MTTPATRNLGIYRGDTYAHTVSFVDTDGAPSPLTGSTWLAQIRRDKSSTVVAATFTVDTTNAATGVLVLTLTAEQVTALVEQSYVWDLQRTITSSSAVETLLAGSVSVSRDVSRAV